MPLDFPVNPVDGQVYGNFYYSATKGAWRSTTSFNTPSSWRNAIGTTATSSGVPLVIQGTTSQSANLQEWKNSSNTTLASISSSGVLSAPSALFTGSVSGTQIIGTTPADSGSTGGVAIKAPSSGSQTSAYLQFVNNAYSAQWGGISADSNSNMTVSATQLNLPTKTYAPGSVVQVQYYTEGTYTTGTSSAWTDIYSGLRLNFTPKFTSSKMIIVAAFNFLNETSRRQVTRMLRDGVVTGISDVSISNGIASGWTNANMIYQWQDTTAHTAGTQVTYSFQTAVTAGTWYYNYNYGGVNGTSTFAIWEVAV